MLSGQFIRTKQTGAAKAQAAAQALKDNAARLIVKTLGGSGNLRAAETTCGPT
jgi:hypothetical protein